MKEDKVYMAVTADKYELPIFIANTPKELANILGVSVRNLRDDLYHGRNGKNKGYRLIKIVLD